MIDAVYPLNNSSKFKDDFELRYSLRSLMLQDWIGNVFLVGHCPEWSKDVVHIPCGDIYLACKDASIINKILLACSNRQLDDPFLVNSDDQYFLRPICVEDLEPMLEDPSPFAEYKFKAGINSWHRRVVETVQWCAKHGYPDWIFQSHAPYLVNKEAYIGAMCKVPWGRENGFTTHVYLNLTQKEHPQKEPKGRTIRLKGRVQAIDIDKQVERATFLNHNDEGLTPNVKAFLEKRFPIKSKWEK